MTGNLQRADWKWSARFRYQGGGRVKLDLMDCGGMTPLWLDGGHGETPLPIAAWSQSGDLSPQSIFARAAPTTLENFYPRESFVVDQTFGYSQPLLYLRESSLLASESPTHSSFSPSQVMLRPSLRLNMPSRLMLVER